MPHSIKESHLEELCNNCKQPHGKEIVVLVQHHKQYHIIMCQNCGYEIWKTKGEEEFNDKWEMFHRI